MEHFFSRRYKKCSIVFGVSSVYNKKESCGFARAACLRPFCFLPGAVGALRTVKTEGRAAAEGGKQQSDAQVSTERMEQEKTA